MNKTDVKIGMTASVDLDGLLVQVKVLDTKQVFGRLDVKVTPVKGSGEKWISSDRLE
jgi:hypothetical protein